MAVRNEGDLKVAATEYRKFSEAFSVLPMRSLDEVPEGILQSN